MTLLFISTYILAAINDHLYNQRKIELLANANIVANVISDSVKADDDRIGWLVSQLKVDNTSRIIVTDNLAKVIYDTAEYSDLQNKTLMKEEIIAALNGQDTVNVDYNDDIGAVLEGAVTVISDTETVGTVYISETAQDTEDFVAEIRWILIAISLVVCLLVGVLSWVMADIIISPIEKLTKFVSDFDLSKMDTRFDVTGKDEISELGLAFNSMADRIEEMEEKRRIFVSNASHELKTPLSSIKLLSESILTMQTEPDSYITEFMTDINGEVDRLARIVDRLLTLTKLDAGTEPMELKNTSVNMLLERIVRALKPQADRKNIAIAVVEESEVFAEIDLSKMWQVVYNLTDNAIKYTPAGGVVKVVLHDQDDYCRIDVIDNGIGIPKQDAEHIFDRFYRVDKARSRESGGTGLGLSIVKDMVELHQGKIMLNSVEGEGSDFSIVFPKKHHREKEVAQND
ncbi:MAG: HAMP domain-containing histidine kinase [Clostridia bacterium]|nr:HAMP domain-containing histidine kinase [Clostridia bacterium]